MYTWGVVMQFFPFTLRRIFVNLVGFFYTSRLNPPPPPQTQSITTVLHRMRKENVSHRTLPSLVALSISIGVARDKNLVTTVSEKVLLILNSQH